MTKTSIAKYILLCLGMGLLSAASGVAGAAPGHEPGAGRGLPSGVELIAFEAPGCIYCPVFRRDVLPTYAATRAGKAAPLRFVDLNDAAADSFELSGPVTMVPTLVLVRDGVEIGRISGYFGRENVHHMLDAMLPRD
jgi:hypothetical protein